MRLDSRLIDRLIDNLILSMRNSEINLIKQTCKVELRIDNSNIRHKIENDVKGKVCGMSNGQLRNHSTE